MSYPPKGSTAWWRLVVKHDTVALGEFTTLKKRALEAGRGSLYCLWVDMYDYWADISCLEAGVMTSMDPEEITEITEEEVDALDVAVDAITQLVDSLVAPEEITEFSERLGPLWAGSGFTGHWGTPQEKLNAKYDVNEAEQLRAWRRL